MFDSLSAGVYVTDLDGRILAVNPAAQDILGYRDVELIGASAHELFHHTASDGRRRPVETCPILRVRVTGGPIREDEDMFWRSDGTGLPVAWVSAPLRRDGRIEGAVVAFSDTTDRRAAGLAREEALLAAHALEHAVLMESEERSHLLVELADVLATLDLDEGLRRLARFLAGRLGDWVVVDALDGASLARVAVAGPGEQTAPRRTPLGPLPPLTRASQGILARALTTGHVQHLGAGPDTGTDALDAEKRRVLEALNARHALVVPIVARTTVLGAITLIRTGGEAFSPHDSQLAGEIGRRAGLALDNARLHDQQRSAAEVLQRSMLTVLPRVAGIQLAATYRPAAAGVEVGGDWYDAFVRPDGETVLVIGDVVGHDIHAASSMGQLRNLLRAICVDRSTGPADVLRRVERTVDSLDAPGLATCCVVHLGAPTADRTRSVTWSNAGHPPPVLCTADGEVTLLDPDPEILLGAVAGAQRTDHAYVLRPGESLWLYTDGLIEQAGEDLGQGLARLREALHRTAADALQPACDALADTLARPGHLDDVAILAARLAT